MAVYLEDTDDTQQEAEQTLPLFTVGDTTPLLDLVSEQHFTEPPPRYSEASLVKALEEYGIGRPSTYASIISTLTQREYVQLENKRFVPTDVGRIVNKFLTAYFQTYVDYDFTARLEDDLDAISRGEIEWIPLLQRFWTPFSAQIQTTQAGVKRSDVTQEKIDEACPKCSQPLAIRLGRRGRFIGCTAYPECDYTRPLEEDSQPASEPIEGRTCPSCGAGLVLKQSRYGKFIGCAAYPECKYTEPLEKPQDTGIVCPQCHHGNLLKKRARSGRFFYSCATYPTCRYAVFNEPIAESCPQCQWPILTQKITQRHGEQRVCPQAECGYTQNADGSIAPPQTAAKPRSSTKRPAARTSTAARKPTAKRPLVKKVTSPAGEPAPARKTTTTARKASKTAKPKLATAIRRRSSTT
jgi:DNA topoisomerase-1